MFIITDKRTNVVLAIGERLERIKENGYPVLVNENVAFPPKDVDIYEGDCSGVSINDISKSKICYNTVSGFYENPRYVSPEERIKRTEEYQAGYDQAILDMIEQGVL